jgi:hypothetical protein
VCFFLLNKTYKKELSKGISLSLFDFGRSPNSSTAPIIPLW